MTARADAPPPAPSLPAIVQKYVNTVRHLPALTVQAAQIAGPDTTDTATLRLSPPNKLLLVSTVKGKALSTTVCDGKTVTQWDDKQYAQSPAPKSLADMDTPLPTGAAASIAASLLTDPTSITDYAHLRDLGIVTVDGQRAHKVQSIEDADTATFWLSDKTALPLRAVYTGGHHDRTIALRDYHFSPFVVNGITPTRPAGLNQYVAPPPPTLLAAGTPAPDFTLHHASGTGVLPDTLTLSSLKGQVVLLDFWASWCRPCKKTMPHIQELQSRDGGKGLTILSINTWDTPPRMAAFIKTHPNYTTTFLCDPTPADQSVAVTQYHVYGIPTVYIIDKDGHVATALVGDDPQAARQINAALTRLGVPQPAASLPAAP